MTSEESVINKLLDGAIIHYRSWDVKDSWNNMPFNCSYLHVMIDNNTYEVQKIECTPEVIARIEAMKNAI